MLVLAVAAHGAELTVCSLETQSVGGCGMSNYTSFADAIAAADPGDTLLLTPGTFEEAFGVTKDIIIEGQGIRPTITAYEPDKNEQSLIVVLNGSHVVLRNVSLTSTLLRPLELRDFSTAELDNCVVTSQALFTLGGGVRMWAQTDLVAFATAFDDARASEGGHIYVDGASLSVSDSSFIDGFAPGRGGAILAKGNPLNSVQVSLENVSFEGNRSQISGGAVLTEFAELSIVGGEFEGNETDGLGGALSFMNGEGSIEGTRFSDNEGGDGGAIANLGGELELRGVDVVDNHATGEGGGVYNLAALDMRGSTLCSNGAMDGAGLFSSGTLTAHHTRFLENGALDDGGALKIDAGTAELLHVNVIGNVAPSGASLALEEESELTLVSSLFAYNAGGNNVDGSAGAMTHHHNAWFANAGSDLQKGYGNRVVLEDPQLTGWVGDGICANDRDWHRWLSPLRDAGDPGDVDPDGTVGDIGAYGGTDGMLWGELWQDEDGDGFDAIYDCDDDSAKIHPDADDEPYDGLDANCDGWSDNDGDLDGFDAITAGGTDCDDTNPAVFPGAAEDPDDGLPNDCRGDEQDADLDGFPLSQDCDDTDPLTHPGAAEEPGIDRNCDGIIDVIQPVKPRTCASAPFSPAALVGWLGRRSVR